MRRLAQRGNHSRRPAVAELMESRVLLAAQVVSPVVAATPLTVGQQLNVAVNYDVQDPAANAPTGLGLRLHYDSNVLRFDALSNVLQDGFSASEDRLEDVDDGNIRTDRVVNILWLKLVGGWPSNSLPASLLTAQFTSLATVDSSAVNFTGETSPGYSFTSMPVAIDNVAPAVTVDIADALLSDADTSSEVTFEFSEPVAGFNVNDVTVSNGTLSDFSAVDSNTFTATFIADDGIAATGAVNVIASSYTDAAGNTGSTGSDNVSVETINPTVTVNIVDATLSDSDNSSNVNFEFSEPVLSFTTGDVVVSGGTLSGLVPIDEDSFTATFTAANGTSATGSVTVVASSYTDAAGNTGSSGTDNVSIDTLNPTVVITPNGTSTSESSILFTFQFNETVNGFVSGDISIMNGSAGAFTIVDGDTFTLDVTPLAPGIVAVGLAAGAAQDAAGNDNVTANATVTSQSPSAVTLPASDSYELLLVGPELVLKIAGGAEQFRRLAANVSFLAITGSAGDDIVTVLNSGGAVATPILFSGKRGDDLFDASLVTGSTTILGGSGNDTLTGGAAGDIMIGGSGKDVISGNAGNDHVFGRSGRDTLTGGSGNDTIRGGRGRDSIEGSNDTDLLVGGGGADTISGGDGNDRIIGGPGRDILSGGDDADLILGRGGQDVLDGDAGDDTLIGGSAPDDLAGGLGNDTLNGVFRDDTFNQQVGPDLEIGGQRPAPRPAPVSATSRPDESAVPSFKAPQVDNEEIDEFFEGSLLPRLLEL